VANREWGFGVAVGDYDNDGDPDLYVTNLGPNVLYRNKGDGTFENVTQKAGVGDGDRWSSSAAFFDMDDDGDLDLYVANYMVCTPSAVPRAGTPEAQAKNCAYRGIQVFCGPIGQTPVQDALYRNNGDGTFTDVTKGVGMWLDTPRYGLGIVTADFDSDGDQDVYVANDSVASSLWENDGHGMFKEVGLAKGVAFNADGRAQAGMGTDSGDYDGDGWLDLALTTFSQDLKTVYHNIGGKFFVDVSQLVGMNVTYMQLSWGVGFHDFDLDGDEDLFIANGHVYPQVDGHGIGTSFRQANHLFRNDGKRFVEVGKTAGPSLAVERSFRGAAFADYDDDGDVDVFVTALDDAGMLLRNDSPRGERHWLEVRLVGKKSNKDGVGARVKVTSAGKTWIRERKGGGSYLSAHDPRLHFGLGTLGRVERIEVRWPSGHVDTLGDAHVDRVITIREGQTTGGSP
jgi:enediyne biosynthesis protein E4